MNVYGADIACGYDIACAFSTTLHNSSLGNEAKKLRFHLVVGSFHGHAHNWLCQLDWHPLNVSGMGQSDSEGCKCIFAASNAVASSTRHGSKFHCWQAIEEHFLFWDDDKYANLCMYCSFLALI